MNITRSIDPVSASLQRTSDFYAVHPRVDAADCSHVESADLYPYDPMFAEFRQCCDCAEIVNVDGNSVQDPRHSVEAVAA